MTLEELNEERRRAVLSAGEACIQWMLDTGDCHFCNPNGSGRHEHECPLRTYFLSLFRAKSEHLL